MASYSDQFQNVVVTNANQISILETLGEGGYGLVYKAKHSEWGTVAYKKLIVQFVNESNGYAIFIRYFWEKITGYHRWMSAGDKSKCLQIPPRIHQVIIKLPLKCIN